MTPTRVPIFTRPRDNHGPVRPQPSQRSGVFGANRAGQGDRASAGLQQSRNTVQGLSMGGNRLGRYGPTNRQYQANQQRQLMAQHVGNLRGRVNTPSPRVPIFRRAPVSRGVIRPSPRMPIRRSLF